MNTVITRKGYEIKKAFQVEFKEEMALFEKFLSVTLNINELRSVPDSYFVHLFEEYFGCEEFREYLIEIGKSYLFE